MSTRAIFSFYDKHSPKGIHVYKHSDGYPSGAFDAIGNAFPFAWPLPRFEADEFAAAFVCGNKIPYWVETQFIKFIEDAKKYESSAKKKAEIIELQGKKGNAFIYRKKQLG